MHTAKEGGESRGAWLSNCRLKVDSETNIKEIHLPSGPLRAGSSRERGAERQREGAEGCSEAGRVCRGAVESVHHANH